MPMHSFKFAAALQTAQAGPAPVLLAVDLSSGHGGGETVTQAIAQGADMYAFLAGNFDLRASPTAPRPPPRRPARRGCRGCSPPGSPCRTRLFGPRYRRPRPAYGRRG